MFEQFGLYKHKHSLVLDCPVVMKLCPRESPPSAEEPMVRDKSGMHSQAYCAPAVLDPSTPAKDTDRSYPTTPLMSVELPRWIDHPRVDSQAMLSAFLDYRGRCKKEARVQLDHLYMIVHTQESTFVAGNEVI